MPVLNSVQPVLADFDHALRLYPAPTAVRRHPVCILGRLSLF